MRDARRRRSPFRLCLVMAAPAVAAILLAPVPGEGQTAREAAFELADAPGASIQADGGVLVTPEKLRELAAMPRPESPVEDDSLESGVESEQQWREMLTPDPSRRRAKVLPAGAAEGSAGPQGDGALAKGPWDKVAQSPLWLTSWTAAQAPSTGPLAADTGIAVSATFVVVTTRTTIGYYEKSGRKLMQIDTPTFFSPLGLGSQKIDTYFDTRSIFDGYRNRFWVAALAYNSEAWDFTKPAEQQDPARVKKRRNKFVVAVSKTADPRDGWYLYSWDGTPGDGQPGLHGFQAGDSADYPLLGVDAFGIYETNTVGNVVPGVTHKTTQLVFFPAAKLAGGQFASGWMFYDLKNPDATPVNILQPVVHHGASLRTWFVTRFDYDKVAVWGLTGHLTSSQLLTVSSVTLNTFDNPVDAPQYGVADKIQLTNLATHPLKAVYRNSRLYVTFHDGANFFGDGKLTACRFARLNVAAYPTVLKEVDRTFGGRSDIYDNPIMRVHYAFPAVEANKNGDAVIVYGRSSAWNFPEVSYSVYPASGPDVLPSRRLAVGQDRLVGGASPLPLYDLNGASVDPFDDTSVWIAAPATIWRSVAPQNNFAVRVAKVLGARYADLVPLGTPWVSTTSVPAGGNFKVIVEVRNQGDELAPASKVGVYLVNSNNVTTVVGYITTSAVISGQSRSVSATFSRGTLPKGYYTLKIVADATLVVPEYSNVNNGSTASAKLHLN
jgi:CARDB protein